MHKKAFDIIILGGGIAGSLAAISIKRKTPDFKIAIIERNSHFPKKVGESTSDLTTLYFRHLKLNHLLDKHPKKAGLRFLFNEQQSNNIENVAEFNSPTLKSSIGGRHLNRQVFDEDMLSEAEKMGCTVIRPATITAQEIQANNYTFTVSTYNTTLQLHAPKMLDATGRVRYLKQHLGWKDLTLNLRNAAIFTRMHIAHPTLQLKTKVADFWKQNAINSVEYGTTHFMRKHAWFWLIRLSETSFSLGLVFDTTHHKVEDPKAFFKQQLEQEPLLAAFQHQALNTEVQFIPQLSYCSERLYQDGAAVIGDSGAFTDPFISPGLEMICQQAAWLSELYAKEFQSGKHLEKQWKKYERAFLKSYQSRDTIYTHWYSIMHDYDLMKSWMRISLFVYFGLYTNPAYAFPSRLKIPIRSKGISQLGLRIFMARIKAIARKKQRREPPKKALRNTQKHRKKITYSGVRIANGFQLILLPIQLFFKWLGSYIALEWKHVTR